MLKCSAYLRGVNITPVCFYFTWWSRVGIGGGQGHKFALESLELLKSISILEEKGKENKLLPLCSGFMMTCPVILQ